MMPRTRSARGSAILAPSRCCRSRSLCGGAVAAAGPDQFCRPRRAPHAARALVRSRSAVADRLFRFDRRAAAGASPISSGASCYRPARCRVGIMTALIGGPLFACHCPQHPAGRAMSRRRPASVGTDLAHPLVVGAASTRARSRPMPSFSACSLALSLWSLSGRRLLLCRSTRSSPRLPAPAPVRDSFIVLDLRLPRLLTGVLRRASLLVSSGSIFQSMARNPLASPDVIGFECRRRARRRQRRHPRRRQAASSSPLGALLPAVWLTAAVVSTASARQGGGVASFRLVLVGIGIGFFAYASADFLLTRGDIFEASAARAWRSLDRSTRASGGGGMGRRRAASPCCCR